MEINEKTIVELGWAKKKMEYEFASLVWYEKTYVVNGVTFYLTLRDDSNTVGRDWFVHVDNCDCQTVASLDVSTFEQIDSLLKLCIPEI